MKSSDQTVVETSKPFNPAGLNVFADINTFKPFSLNIERNLANLKFTNEETNQVWAINLRMIRGGGRKEEGGGRWEEGGGWWEEGGGRDYNNINFTLED